MASPATSLEDLEGKMASRAGGVTQCGKVTVKVRSLTHTSTTSLTTTLVHTKTTLATSLRIVPLKCQIPRI